MDDLILDFLSETGDGIETISKDLLELESDPTQLELVKEIFRIFHTIKGTCGFLGFDKMAKIAHFGESILNDVRDEKVEVTKPLIDILFKVLDAIKNVTQGIKENGEENFDDFEQIIHNLERDGLEIDGIIDSIESHSQPQDTVKIDFIKEQQVSIQPKQNKSDAEINVKDEIAKAYDIKLKKSKAGEAKKSDENDNNEIIKVKLSLLDKLMQGVSELVLTRNQILQLEKKFSNRVDSSFEVPIQRLDIITSDLQENILKTRMQPIASIWSSYPRVIREMANNLQKNIKVVMSGEETEIDRHIIESIKDPLMHMLRNCADHGIETPKDRIAAGKDEAGVITLNAFHQAGQIVISVKDDGKGLDIEKICEKIIALNLLDEVRLKTLTESQIYQYIFHPGFSTAATITSVSGRGVGMDVVKNNIEKIGGAIDLVSENGKGTEFTLKIPLTLAIMPALIIRCEVNKFAIPLICVYEIIKVNEMNDSKVEKLNNSLVLKMRGNVTPLILMCEVLGYPKPHDINNKYIVICKIGRERFGVVVDKIYDIEEIVVKPNSTPCKDLTLYSGSTILGDGAISLILDPNYLCQYVKQDDKVSISRQHENNAKATSNKQEVKSKFLTFVDLPDANNVKAIPLDYVTRLEELSVSKIEEVSGTKVYQYRDCLMRIVPFNPDFDYSKQEDVDVIVFTNSGELIGLVVAEVRDILEHVFDNKIIKSPDPMYLSTMVLEGKSTQIVDVSFFYKKSISNANENDEDEASSVKTNQNSKPKVRQDMPHILLVDDSPFFRKFIPPVIVNAGYKVSVAESVEKAMDILNTEKDICAIVTDLQMPGLSGSDLVEYIKASDALNNIPIIALSAFNSDEARKRGQDLSLFDAFIPKTHHNMIVDKLNELVA